jgi:hypothetical protein
VNIRPTGGRRRSCVSRHFSNDAGAKKQQPGVVAFLFLPFFYDHFSVQSSLNRRKKKRVVVVVVRLS